MSSSYPVAQLNFDAGESAERGEFDEALTLHNRALALNPVHWNTYYCRASTLKKAGDFNSAGSDYKRSVTLIDQAYQDPFMVEEYNEQKREGESLKEYVDRHKPMLKRSVLGSLGVLYAEIGLHVDAVEWFDAVIALGLKDYGFTHVRRGKSKLALGDREGAVLDWQEAIILRGKPSPEIERLIEQNR